MYSISVQGIKKGLESNFINEQIIVQSPSVKSKYNLQHNFIQYVMAGPCFISLG